MVDKDFTNEDSIFMLEAQQKHLDIIQGIINRLAQNSFTIKGWAVALVSAILVVAHEIAGWPYLLIALLPAIVFWGFDAYYLRQEKLYRALHNVVRFQSQVDWEQNPFALDANLHSKDVKSWISICLCQTVAWLYIPMLLLIIAVTIYSAIYAK